MTHINMHNIKREPQLGSFNTRITAAQTDGATTNTVVFTDNGAQSAFTSYTRTFEETIQQPVTTFVTTRTEVIRVTDAASFSSLQASESSASAAQETSSTAKTSSATAGTSTATSHSSSTSNLSTLIPAIVVPVAAILIISFVLFWFIMRRRHQRQLKEEPEFVMASKPEKTISRGNSNSSGHSSTRELVPMSKLEKEVAVTTTEMRKSSLEVFAPKYSSADIGVARPMTPPDKASQGAAMKEKSFTNFSSVRPSTSHKSKLSQDHKSTNRSRSNSATAQRGLPPRSPPKSSRGPPPGATRGPNIQPPRPFRPDEQNFRMGSASPARTPGPPLKTNMNNGNRAAPPQALNPPTPTGAFNGASPISQYSPIIKGQFNLGAAASSNVSDGRGQAPSALRNADKTTNKDTDSPIDENVLSHENMRIARLANSSRLGFNHSPVEPNFPSKGNNINTTTVRALSPLVEGNPKTEPPATSPRLPPPLSREDMLPKPFARGLDSPAGGSSIYPSPSVGADATPRLGMNASTVSLPHSERTIGVTSTTNHRPRDSVVSRLSSDDGYVDMDVDAKSDVSSLDEREKWEMESDSHAMRSPGGAGYNGSGYGSAGMSPVDGPAGASSAGTGTTKPGLRDRDSEGPFVLSRY